MGPGHTDAGEPSGRESASYKERSGLPAPGRADRRAALCRGGTASLHKSTVRRPSA